MKFGLRSRRTRGRARRNRLLLCGTRTDPENQRDRWKEQFSELLLLPLNHKSPGVDRITNDQSMYGETALIWEEEAILEDWLKGVIIVIGNRGRETLHIVATTEAP